MARTQALTPTFGALALAAALGLAGCSKKSEPADTTNGVSQADASSIPGNTGTAYDETTGNTVPANATATGFNQQGAADGAGNAPGGAAGGTTRSAPPNSTEPASRFAGKPTMPH